MKKLTLKGTSQNVELTVFTPEDKGTQPGNLVTVGSDGKISSSILPASIINNTYVVSSEAEMLALDANVGDVAVRHDIGYTFILQTAPASDINHWVVLTSHSDGVDSFNGQKGDVVYTAPVSSVNTKTGDVVLDGTNVIVSPTDSRTVAEAIASSSTPTNVVTSVNGFTGDVNAVSAEMSLTHTVDDKWKVSWLENGSTVTYELKNFRLIDIDEGTLATLAAPAFDEEYGIGYIHKFHTKEVDFPDLSYTSYIGVPRSHPIGQYHMVWIEFSISDGGVGNGGYLYLRKTNSGGGNADTATKLATARALSTDLGSNLAADFDGSADAAMGVTGTLPITHGGTGRTDGLAKGISLTISAVGDDLNNYTTSGNWYTGDTVVLNTPIVGNKFYMVEVVSNTVSLKQTATSVATNKVYTRTRSGTQLVWSDWSEIGSGGGGSGSVMYGGSFGWDNTPFTGSDTVKKRSTGAVFRIQGGNTGIVTADPNDSGVALFTNPTSKPITVILNPAWSVGRSTGSADTLPKKINVTPTNADIDGGLGDNAHITNGGGSILAMTNVGYTNNQSLMPTHFTIPANGTFRLSFEIDGYGALADTYLVSANATYIAFREDAKVITESVNIPWSSMNVAGAEFKKIGSWTVVRWDVTTTAAGNFNLGGITDVDARPESSIFIPVATASTTGSEIQHLQINQKTGSGAGGVTILNALANKRYNGQFVFNNGSPETVQRPFLENNDTEWADLTLSSGYTKLETKSRARWRIKGDHAEIDLYDIGCKAIPALSGSNVAFLPPALVNSLPVTQTVSVNFNNIVTVDSHSVINDENLGANPHIRLRTNATAVTAGQPFGVFLSVPLS